MCKVKAKIEHGLVSSERVVFIETIDGSKAEVMVPASFTGIDLIFAAEIGRDEAGVLVELPRETTSGSWRIWVRPELVEA